MNCFECLNLSIFISIFVPCMRLHMHVTLGPCLVTDTEKKIQENAWNEFDHVC